VAQVISMKVHPPMQYVLIGLAIILVLAVVMCGDRQAVHQTTSREVRISEDSAKIRFLYRAPNLRLRGQLTRSHGSLILDTILNDDTLHVDVTQDSSITIRLLPAPRSIEVWAKYYRRDSIIRVLETEWISRPWYESPLLVLVGAVLGFLLAIVL
jgi:hypothetical protein